MRILHYLSLLCVLILLQSCLQDDLRTPVLRETIQQDPLNAQTLIMDQTTLEERYAGNTSLEHLFEKDFKKAVSSLSAAKGGSNRTATLDLEHIQVLEADKVHVITYRVQVTDEKEPESKVVYNLVYYSTDRKEYYVTLLKYDFSRISIEQYLKKPTAEVLYLYPLEEGRDTDKNIQYAISSVSPIFVYEIIPPGDCMKEVSVAGTPCKGSGNPKHEYGDNSCSMTGNKRATPGYTYMDFSDCGKNSGGGSGGGGGYPGGGGGGGGSTPGPGSPGGPPAAGGGNPPISVVKPIKNIGDLVKSKILIGQVNMGQKLTNADWIKKMDENPEFEKRLKEIKNASISNYESAYTIFNNAGSGIQFSEKYTGNPNDITSGGQVSLKTDISLILKPLNCIAFIHCHKNDGSTYKVFSFSDITAFCQLAALSTRPQEELALYLTTLDGGTYVMKMTNKIKMKAFYNYIANDFVFNAFDKQLHKILIDEIDKNKQMLEFLKFLNKEPRLSDLGLEFYEEISPKVWQKLTLSSNGKTIIKTNI